MTSSSPFAVLWNSDQLALLRELASSRTAPLRRVHRAHVALACAHGTASAVIARTFRLHLDTVRRRRKRFTAEGHAALEDRPRPGRPRRYGPEAHLAIAATVTSARPAVDSHWTHRAIADHLASNGISASQVGRILAGLDLKPHLVRGWLVRPEDPGFYAKAAEVCALYLHTGLGSPSVDEKTAMQARSRRHPTRRAHPGQLERREFDYRRHGTASIVAALDVHTGQVLVLLAEPGGDILDPGPPAPTPRQVRLPPGPRRADPRIHPRLRRPGATISLVLRQHPAQGPPRRISAEH